MINVYFNANTAFNECNNLPLGKEFLDPSSGKPNFSKTLPFYACGYNDAFFLQLTLNEFSFSEFAPEHPHKSTILYVAREKHRTRFVQVLGKSLPVLVCSIAVNRDEYEPLRIN